jgi:hypothetical protein
MKACRTEARLPADQGSAASIAAATGDARAKRSITSASVS